MTAKIEIHPAVQYTIDNLVSAVERWKRAEAEQRARAEQAEREHAEWKEAWEMSVGMLSAALVEAGMSQGRALAGPVARACEMLGQQHDRINELTQAILKHQQLLKACVTAVAITDEDVELWAHVEGMKDEQQEPVQAEAEEL